MAGQLVSAGIPNLNVVFEDYDGLVFSHLWDGKYVIHSETHDFSSPSVAAKCRVVLDMVATKFKEHGVEDIYTWAETPEQERYANYFGFRKTGVIVNDTFVEKDYPNPVYEYIYVGDHK